MVATTGPLTQKYFEIAGTLCIIPDGIQHDLGDFQSAIEDMGKFGFRDSITTSWKAVSRALHPG